MTNNYTPQARSLAHLVCRELAARPRAFASGDIAKMFDVPSSAVNASLRACVAHGALQMRTVMHNSRSRCEYYPPGFEPPDATSEPCKRSTKAQPLEVVMYDDGEIHVRGHRIGAAADDNGLAVFTAKQMAYLVARVCTPIIEVTP